MSRFQRLIAYVEQVKDKPATMGSDDCIFWPAGWWEQETGTKLRIPSYSSMEEALRLKEEHGVVEMATEAMFEAGAEQLFAYDTPQLGDVGIIRTARYGFVGCIFHEAGGIFWRREDAGAHFMYPSSYVIAWRLPE